MLQVKTPDEVLALIREEFAPLAGRTELVPLDECLGRTLAEDIEATEYVPDFDRSTVDGYAVRARDTFGCSDAIPAILPVVGEVRMGQGADLALAPGTCCAVPTGGALPRGADSAVMLEYTEDYGDGSVGVAKPAAPGQNVIFRGDDVCPGKPVLRAGRTIGSQDVGALAAMGRVRVPVVRRPVVAILSTGDELVPPEARPGPGQVRDVNGPMLAAMLRGWGAEARFLGIAGDDEAALRARAARALESCDALLLSGGSSVGARDAAGRVIESLGTLLLHGVAMKPGKPTLLGKAGDKPVVGLPGHPVAAWFVTRLFVLPLLARLTGRRCESHSVPARLAESVGANHGRAQYQCCRLERGADGLVAWPVRSKSGLITSLAGADGWFCIERDCEGLPAGAEVRVTLTTGE